MSFLTNKNRRSYLSKPLTRTLLICAPALSILLSGGPAMAYPTFTCAYEKDNNPPLDAEADQWFKRARYLEEELGHWPEVVALYGKAIAKDHWKAMHNLARLYRVGEPGTEKNPGIEKDTIKMLELYERMVKLKVPLGYYNWAVIAENGRGVLKSDRMASSYMFQAAQLGSPLAQVRIGQYFAFELPRHKQDDDMAERYYRCAGAQDNPDAIVKTASFYRNAKQNMPRSLFYYQKAASLGSTRGLSYLSGVFEPNPSPIDNFGYQSDEKLHAFYDDLWKQLRADPNLRFPNLMKDHPHPAHPTQGFDAEHPDRRPEL